MAAVIGDLIHETERIAIHAIREYVVNQNYCLRTVFIQQFSLSLGRQFNRAVRYRQQRNSLFYAMPEFCSYNYIVFIPVSSEILLRQSSLTHSRQPEQNSISSFGYTIIYINKLVMPADKAFSTFRLI